MKKLYLYANETWKKYTGLTANKIKQIFLSIYDDFIIYNYA